MQGEKQSHSYKRSENCDALRQSEADWLFSLFYLGKQTIKLSCTATMSFTNQTL